MICLKCKGNNVRVSVDIIMHIDPEDVHKITKKSIQKKSTELWGAKWDKAQVICRDCNYIHVGC